MIDLGIRNLKDFETYEKFFLIIIVNKMMEMEQLVQLYYRQYNNSKSIWYGTVK